MYAFSSGGANGTGMSGAVMRTTGASRCSNASSAIVAAISAPKPAVRVSSCRTSTFEQRSTPSRTRSLSHGMSVRRSSTSASKPSFASSSAASVAVWTIAPHVTIVASSPSRWTRA